MEYWWTTLFILGLTTSWSLLGTAYYLYRGLSGSGQQAYVFSTFSIPSIILAPTVLTLGFLFLKYNFVYPSGFESSLFKDMLACVAPSLILFITSGLWGGIRRNCYENIRVWKNKPFVLASRAYGVGSVRTLGKLIGYESFVASWSLAVPVVFAELIVVEALFNAPGVGWEIWHAAKVRNLEEFVWCILPFVGTMAVVQVLILFSRKSISNKLESYN